MVINTQGHTGMIRNLSFTPDGSSLISISEDKTIRFWNMQTGFLERTLRGQLGDGVDGMLYSSAISNDGLYFAISGYPSTYGIRTFNLRTGEQTKTLKGNTDVINDLCFSPNGSFLASACSDNIVRIYDFFDNTHKILTNQSMNRFLTYKMEKSFRVKEIRL